MDKAAAFAKFAPWRAAPLARAATSKHFRRTMDLAATEALLGRSAIIAGWIVFGVGIAALLTSMAVLLTIPPPKTEFRVLEVDHSTGIVSLPVSLEDAPTLFSEATDREYIKRYILACEQWDPPMDHQNTHLCELMSTPEQQARHEEWRHRSTSPPKAVGPHGHVVVDNLRYHRKPPEGKSRHYAVQFDRTVWRGADKNSMRIWTGEIVFQYHPELPMTPQDRDDNGGGFQSSSYSSTPDTPEPGTEMSK